jgi:hypothetical protein
MNANGKGNVAKGVQPPAETQRAVRKLIAEGGEFSAASALGISRQTLARVGCGLSVNRMTLKGVQEFFSRGVAKGAAA